MRVLTSNLVLVFVLSGTAGATDRFVAATGFDSGDCTASPSPCRTIQFAVDVSASDDHIHVAAGDYRENIRIDTRVNIEGAGDGATTVDGTLRGSVFWIRQGAELALSEMSVIRGAGTEVSGHARGGGIFNQNGTVTLTNVTISDCSTAGSQVGGGGIYNQGHLTLINCTVRDNTTGSLFAVADGGGIYHESGTLAIEGCEITGNSSGEGAGIYIWSGAATVSDSTIRGNTGGGDGGINNSGTLSISGSEVMGNTADMGGGLYNAGTLIVNRSTVSGNFAVWRGGGIYNSEWGTATFHGCTVSGNMVEPFGIGGGVCNAGILTMTNCTISANLRARVGGGFYNFGSVTSEAYTILNSCTISHNYAEHGGAGVRDTGQIFVIRNTLIAGNLDSDQEPSDCSGALTSEGHNLIGSIDVWGNCRIEGDPTGNITGVDPALVLESLSDNGGATQTCALPAGSPAIDAGDPAGCGWPTDQRGERRHTDGDCDTAAIADIGAYEAAGCGGPDPTVYESINPDMGGALLVGTASTSPYDHLPGVGTELYYQVDDGWGWPDEVKLVKGGQGVLIHF